MDEAVGQKRKYPFAHEDVSCSICKELLYDPRSFGCSHVVCGPCSTRLKPLQPCPECNWQPDPKFVMIKNHALRKIVNACYPKEYEERHKEYEMEMWIHEKGLVLKGFNVWFSNISKEDVLQVLKALDKMEIWNRNKANFASTSAKTRKQVFSNTCSILLAPGCSLKWMASVDEALPNLVAQWDEATLFVWNTGPSWFAEKSE